jgi:flagellar assembly protein FliH
MSGLTAWERWELASLETLEATTAAAANESLEQRLDPAEIERIAGQAAARAEAERLGRAADALEQAMQEFNQSVADELLALATEIARQVVRQTIAVHPETIQAVVNEALAQFPHQHATIYLNPQDASLVRSYAGDALAHAGHRLLEESSLNPGDCVVESGNSQIDATLATRWRRVLEGIGLQTSWIEPGTP